MNNVLNAVLMAVLLAKTDSLLILEPAFPAAISIRNAPYALLLNAQPVNRDISLMPRQAFAQPAVKMLIFVQTVLPMAKPATPVCNNTIC
jgi:hypothetical protein